jgi:hypothetical protein
VSFSIDEERLHEFDGLGLGFWIGVLFSSSFLHEKTNELAAARINKNCFVFIKCLLN